ncbi:hypothetical protein AB0L54_35775, partial [Streptomyces sp. NPDC052196]|uniref:hypothetical protein n=1 Tax=Streptomyces sp. NPDC052196 TaxID=3156691 RepID=UPI00341D0EED
GKAYGAGPARLGMERAGQRFSLAGLKSRDATLSGGGREKAGSSECAGDPAEDIRASDPRRD